MSSVIPTCQPRSAAETAQRSTALQARAGPATGLRVKFDVEIVARGVDYSRFRQLYYSEEFNQAVAHEAKLKERTHLELVRLPDGKERRRVRIVPNVHLPAAVQGLLNGQPIAYEEITVFDPQARSATFAIHAPATDKVQVTGVARYIEEPGCVRLRFDGEAHVKVFGIGGLAERYIVNEVKGRYDLVARLLQQFIDENRSVTTKTLIPEPAQ